MHKCRANETIYGLTLCRSRPQAFGCACVCARVRVRVCACVSLSVRRRDFYCVSENSFSVCDHCGVTHGTSGLEVFLMDPHFQCEGPTIQEVKAPCNEQMVAWSQMLSSADIYLLTFTRGIPAEGSWVLVALTGENRPCKRAKNTDIGRTHRETPAGCGQLQTFNT